MHQQMHFSRVILLKIFIHLNPMDHTTGQHAICLPALIILQETTYQKHNKAQQKATNLTLEHQAWAWALHWQQDGSNLVSLKVSKREGTVIGRSRVQETTHTKHTVNRFVPKKMQDRHCLQGSQNTSESLDTILLM